VAAEPGLARAAGSELEAAARAGISVVAASGDFGAADLEPGTDDLYPYPAVAWPASDPLVTAVGGTRLRVSAAGRPDGPVSAVSDGSDRAGGGGLSALYTRPAYQDSVANVVGDRRGVPDISMDADMCSLVVMYTRAGGAGWEANGGTSVAAPLFAGIVADAAGLAGHRLGPINPVLYRLHGTGDGLADVTDGSTNTAAMHGYQAVPGYDLATGLGTISDATRFAAALAAASPPAAPASTPTAPVIA
jgi:subtilase family serine protease